MIQSHRIRRRFLFGLLASCGALLVPAFSTGGQGGARRYPSVSSYNIIDVGTFGGLSSNAYGVNDQGQVVGGADTSQGLRHAYRWENGVMTDLGTLGFPTAQSEAKDVNNNGVVVGNVGTGDPNKAFIWEDGVQSEIGPAQVLKSAYGINDAKQVVGQFIVAPSGDKHAFLWQNGTLTDMGTLGGTRSIAWAVNRTAQIVGSSFITGGGEHACLWENGTITDLGNLGTGNSEGFDINDSGEAIGWAQRDLASKSYHAFVWKDGQMTDLGALGGFSASSAEGINNDGVVVGLATGGPFIYDPRLGMRILQNLIPQQSGWSNLHPLDINSAGWIVGYGTNPSGFAHAFLMTPVTVIPAISEYGSMALILLLLVCGTLLLRGRSTTY